jgi:16S rRNA (guanine966-N2)-methyltransferase
MRVVSGVYRGRQLAVPEGRDTRPTGDRVRGAIFNSLQSFDAVVGARAVDLFAGSGALGIEALSRGAAHCTFVESARPALSAIRANLARLGIGADEAAIVPRSVELAIAGLGHVDLALCDPPYAFDGWPTLLAALDADVVVIESDRVIEIPADLQILKQKQYSGTVVTIVRRPSGVRPTGDPVGDLT